MITEIFTVTAKRTTLSDQNSAELSQRPKIVTLGRVSSGVDIGSITLTGPEADDLDLGDEVVLTLKKRV